MIPHISIISSSVRHNRNSHRVALYFEQYLKQNGLATIELLDLKEYNFPIFDNPLKSQKHPLEQANEFANKIKTSDGILIITPEYNGGYPASLKNAIDLLLEEWRHKPIAISTVSSGVFGGSQAITSLEFSLWKMKASIIGETFPVPKVMESFDEKGTPKMKEATDKLAKIFIDELLKCIEINKSNIEQLEQSSMQIA